MSIDDETVLVSQLRETEPLIDGRVRQTYDVLGYAGLMVRWLGWLRDGEYETDSQFFETSDGRRFDLAADAVKAWEGLQPPLVVVGSITNATAASKADAEIQSRRFIARSLIPSRLKALNDAGIRHLQLNDGHSLVADRFEYYPATGFWRDRNGTAHGYTIERLIEAARGAQEPAAGRDSVTAIHPHGPPAAVVAESVAGPVSFDTDHGGTASRLPRVTP